MLLKLLLLALTAPQVAVAASIQIAEAPSGPALIVGRAVKIEATEIATSGGDSAGVHLVRLHILDVVAGEWSNRNSDEVLIRLSASHPNYITQPHEIIVLIDPVRLAQRTPLYWRRFERFLCVNRRALGDLSLRSSQLPIVAVEEDICMKWGP